MTGWLVIARREFLERVRTRWFAIVTALGPLFLIGLIVVPVLLAGLAKPAKIEIVDHSGKLAKTVQTSLARDGWTATIRDDDPSEDTLLAEIREKKINGFLVIAPDAVDHGPIVYQGDNATAQAAMGQLRLAVTTARIMARANLKSDAELAALLSVNFATRHTTGEAATASGGEVFILGYIVMIILYMAIVLYAVNVMRSVVQEKTNRIVEIMAAAAKPRALMLGKILGVGAVGLAQLVAWTIMAIAVIHWRVAILGLFGVSANLSLPSLSAGDVVVILVDFFLGYFFYASLYAAVGAMVSSDQEAQQAQMPITMLLVITMICMQLVANDPRGPAAEALTLVPFSSPILMPMRWLLGGASALDVALSFGILAACTWGVAVLSARIYRVGILMYGKRPGLGELIRWLRH